MADEISKRVKQNFTLIYKSSERMRDSAAHCALKFENLWGFVECTFIFILF